MNQLLDILKAIGSLGMIGVLTKFLIDRLWSTEIEFSIETNYSRAFREFFNLCIAIIYFSFIGIILYFLIDTSQTIQYDVVTSGQFAFTEKDYKASLDMKEKNEQIQFIIIMIGLFIFSGSTYGFFRSFWYNNYRRRTYVVFKSKKFYVIKRITKDRLLFVDDKKRRYKIVELSKLNNRVFKVEGIKERRDERYLSYYKNFVDMKKWNRRKTMEKVMIIALVMFLSLVVISAWLIQEDKIFFGIILLVMFGSIYFFNRRQFKKGEELKKIKKG